MVCGMGWEWGGVEWGGGKEGWLTQRWTSEFFVRTVGVAVASVFAFYDALLETGVSLEENDDLERRQRRHQKVPKPTSPPHFDVFLCRFMTADQGVGQMTQSLMCD